MLVAGANRLEVQKKLVDEMNVFPVPDGDTGTNMSLTVTSAVKEVMAVSSDSVSDIAKALSSGALRGARGNSGVIVSQLFRGLYKGLKGCETIDSLTFASAMQRGVATAYKAVMKPKEGTIL
ncbi:MAG: DAK2 domain-containing protein, partial [Firmicutes bacterium]|nr:DAK2 domain-containing protein [Bacillota bacterium]